MSKADSFIFKSDDRCFPCAPASGGKPNCKSQKTSRAIFPAGRFISAVCSAKMFPTSTSGSESPAKVQVQYSSGIVHKINVSLGFRVQNQNMDCRRFPTEISDPPRRLPKTLATQRKRQRVRLSA